MNDNDVDISEQELFEKCPEVLRALLKDHTRTEYEIEKAKKEGREVADGQQWNIIWGTENYQCNGSGFGKEDQITEERITSTLKNIIRPRALKDRDVQRQRSRDMAEVFTPAWVCNAQNNLVDEAWFGRPDVFNSVDKDDPHRWIATEGKITFDEEPSAKSTRSWKDYVRDLRLEITCGEAPYLVSRYDAVSGNAMPLKDRVGLLDRKLRVVSENTESSSEWLEWAQEAVKATYGFEWQGDNLLLAREAVLFTVIDYYREKFKKEPIKRSLEYFAYIISWNLWQMDGLKRVIPYSCDWNRETQQDLFAGDTTLECPACEKGLQNGHRGIKCVIRDWKKKGNAQKILFETLIKKN